MTLSSQAFRMKILKNKQERYSEIRLNKDKKLIQTAKVAEVTLIFTQDQIVKVFSRIFILSRYKVYNRLKVVKMK